MQNIDRFLYDLWAQSQLYLSIISATKNIQDRLTLVLVIFLILVFLILVIFTSLLFVYCKYTSTTMQIKSCSLSYWDE